MSRTGKSVETESTLLVSRAWSMGVGELGLTDEEYRVSCRGYENIPELEGGDDCTTL